MTFSLKQWGLLLGLVTAVGMMKAAEGTSLWLKAHAVGQRMARLHALDNETQRLRTDVAHLRSPSRLAKTMAQSHPKLTAWSTLRASASARGAQVAALSGRGADHE